MDTVVTEDNLDKADDTHSESETSELDTRSTAQSYCQQTDAPCSHKLTCETAKLVLPGESAGT